MAEPKQIQFSKEIIAFSKIVEETFNNVSKDMITLTSKADKNDKVVKAEVNKLKKEILEVKNSVANFKKLIVEIEKKVKKRGLVVESEKPRNNKNEIQELKSELNEIRMSIKNIETKLKMN